MDVQFPKKYTFILDREAKASKVFRWNSVHTPGRLLRQLLLGTIWESFYFCCCCFPQMYNKSTVIKASSWKPIRFFNYVPRKLRVYHSTCFVLVSSLESPVIHTLTHTTGTNFSRRFFLAWSATEQLFGTYLLMSTVLILILTYRQVMKHRTLEEGGDSVLTALEFF